VSAPPVGRLWPVGRPRLLAYRYGHRKGSSAGLPACYRGALGHVPAEALAPGTHHGWVEAKQLQAYLDEFAFRFNRRKKSHSQPPPVFHRALTQASAPPNR
jgi:hypothetical protein